MKMRQYGVRAVQIPEQVGAHDLIVSFDRGFDKGADGSDPGVVDPHVDFAERLDRAPRQLPYRLQVTDIGRQRKRSAALALANGSSLAQHRLPPRRQSDAGAALGEGHRGRPPDAARRAGDDDARCAQISHVEFSRLL